MTFWAASATNPAHRRPVVKAADPRDFGIRAALSHDMTRIAYVALPPGAGHNRSIAELWVANIDGSESHKLMEQVDLGSYANYPLWSPDDRYIVVRRQSSPQSSSAQTISKVDVQTGKETILAKSDEAVWIEPIDWSPDGSNFYYRQGVDGKPTVWSVPRDGGTPQFVTVIDEDSSPRCYYLSPDGTNLLCSEQKSRDPVQYQVTVVSVVGVKGKQIIDEASGASRHYHPIWGVYDSEITVDIPSQGQTPAELQVINIETRAARTIFLEGQASYVPYFWSPDGEWLAAHERSNPGGDIYLIGSDGTSIHRIPASGAISILGWITTDLTTGK